MFFFATDWTYQTMGEWLFTSDSLHCKLLELQLLHFLKLCAKS